MEEVRNETMSISKCYVCLWSELLMEKQRENINVDEYSSIISELRSVIVDANKKEAKYGECILDLQIRASLYNAVINQLGYQQIDEKLKSKKTRHH